MGKDIKIIIQARMSSSRLPNKVLLPINGKPMIFWQIERLKTLFNINQIVLAISNDKSDDILFEYLSDLNVQIFRGPLKNPLMRFLLVVEKYKPHTFVRLTGDCPLVMPELIKEMLIEYNKNNFDYYSNTIKPTFPDGLDVEIINAKSFLEFSQGPLSKSDLEHVSLGMYSKPSKFKIGNHMNATDLSDIRLTVDYKEDFEYICALFKNFEGREDSFVIEELLNYILNKNLPKNLIPGTMRNIALKSIE
jgi:spore coat polysaccharide biosynthesis protein SpsF